ncbi:MAG: hypothetical protein GX605_09105 [Chloroflexi bacterium]|nr:hypothetical protein [Chloroflexota bacterium]
MTLRTRLARALFPDVIHEAVGEALKAVDDPWWRRLGSQPPADPHPDSPLAAYRENPLAFRLVHLMVDHVLGEGVSWPLGDAALAAWLPSWWEHPLNALDLRIRGWLTELVLTGDLFITLHPRADGLTVVRALPSTAVDEIKANPQDLDDEWRFHQVGTADQPDGVWWTAAAHGGNALHFAINRPVGQARGQSDLATVLPWLRRYSAWLRDRAAINRAKAAFVYDVTVHGSEADVARRRAELAHPPPSGSVIIHNEAEEWRAVSSNVEAGEAQADGRALRLMIAAGMGVPLHFLSEGESATRSTAREMGEPTRRSFAERQRVFGRILQEVARAAARLAVEAGAPLPTRALEGIPAPRFPDLTREDNASLSRAAQQIVQALETATARGWLSDDEAARWFRKFAGESDHAIAT